jgi:hypothetical protein
MAILALEWWLILTYGHRAAIAGECYCAAATLGFAGYGLSAAWLHAERVCGSGVLQCPRLCGQLPGVFALRCLLRDPEHRSDLRPGPVRLTRRPDRLDQCGVDFVSLLGKLGDRAQRPGVGNDEVVGADSLCPLLEGGCSLCSCLGHGVHHPVRNVRRAGIA